MVEDLSTRIERYIIVILGQRGELTADILRRQLIGELDRDVSMDDVLAACDKLELDGLIVSRYEEANSDRGTEAQTYWRLME
jgi:hypothetical protein